MLASIPCVGQIDDITDTLGVLIAARCSLWASATSIGCAIRWLIGKLPSKLDLKWLRRFNFPAFQHCKINLYMYVLS